MPNPGAKNNDNELKKNTVELPPIACPTGIRYAAPAPAGASSSTGYAAFDDTSLEPVTSGGALVDVDGNGYRDKMLTMQQAWQMLGLIGQHDALNKSTYVACMKQDVNQLTHQSLLSEDTANWYVQQSRNFPDLPW